MGTMKPTARRHWMLAGVSLVGIAAVVVPLRSPSLRASFSAAYRAFREPSLLDHSKTTTFEPSVSLPRIDENRLLDAAIARDFEKATNDDLDDPESGALSALAMPDLRIPITRRTMRFVKFFSRTETGRTTFGERFARSGKYRAIIEHSLREAGLPQAEKNLRVRLGSFTAADEKTLLVKIKLPAGTAPQLDLAKFSLSYPVGERVQTEVGVLGVRTTDVPDESSDLDPVVAARLARSRAGAALFEAGKLFFAE